jgi:DNA-binding response OmpR family regulator
VSSEGGSVTLAPTEFRLLEYIMERPGNLVTAEELPEKGWGFFPHTGSGGVGRFRVRNLRRKIGKVARGREV